LYLLRWDRERERLLLDDIFGIPVFEDELDGPTSSYLVDGDP
jgi:hypothetical protein